MRATKAGSEYDGGKPDAFRPLRDALVRAKRPTARQMRDLDARIDRVKRDAVETLAEIRSIGRR